MAKFFNSYEKGSVMSTVFKTLLLLVALIPLAMITVGLISLASKVVAGLLAGVFVLAVLAGVVASGFAITNRIKNSDTKFPLAIVWITLIRLFMLIAPGLLKVSYSAFSILLWTVPPVLILLGLLIAWRDRNKNESNDQ